MAHEALFGAHPFPGRTLEERRCAVQRGPPQMRGSLARALRRALEVDPAARYPSLDALLAAFLRAARVTRPRWSRALVAAALAAAGAIAWLVVHHGVR
jgi:serine/threonine protein kinase